MSEPTHDDIAVAVAELPRLRIHHFFVFTTVFAVVMSVQMGLYRLISSSQPDFTIGISLIVLVHAFSQSACIAIALLGLAWRKRGLSFSSQPAFPNQPGHWIALYLTVVWAYEIVLSFASLFLHAQTLNLGVMAWVLMPMGLVFHCFAFALWVAAYLHETSRIWKLGWSAMAFQSLFVVCRTLLLWGRMCVEWLLETYWYRHYNWQFPFVSWGSYAHFMFLLPKYLLLAFLLTTTIIDLRQHRSLHWSHWLVVTSTLISTAIMTVYMHFAF